MKKVMACKNCHKTFSSYLCQKRNFCSQNCYWIDLSKRQAWNKGKKLPQLWGEKHGRWKNGKCLRKDGYIYLSLNGKRILEHRSILERSLGRKLKDNEHTHHLNGNKTDNRLQNLILVTNSEHQKIHNNFWKYRRII